MSYCKFSIYTHSVISNCTIWRHDESCQFSMKDNNSEKVKIHQRYKYQNIGKSRWH